MAQAQTRAFDLGLHPYPCTSHPDVGCAAWECGPGPTLNELLMPLPTTSPGGALIPSRARGGALIPSKIHNSLAWYREVAVGQ